MKVNTLPLVPQYNNTPCNRFWDGFFNYSNRVWVVLHSKGKKLEVIEYRERNHRCLNALKILLLFTGIVPLIAAIYYLIKMNNFKGYQVTLLTPSSLQPMQIREPKEEQAVLETIAEVTPEKNEIQPADAEVAYDYLESNNVELNNQTKVFLSNLEEIPFFQLKKWDLKNPKEVFTKLNKIEVAASDFTDENIPLIKAYSEILRLEFVVDSLNAAQKLIHRQSDLLFSLFKESVFDLMTLLEVSTNHIGNTFKSFNNKIFSYLFSEAKFSKISEDYLPGLMIHYGSWVKLQIAHQLIQELPINIYSLIFKVSYDCKDLLKALNQFLTHDLSLKTKAVISQHPELLDQVYLKLKQVEKCEAFKFALEAYFSSHKILQNPNYSLELTYKDPTLFSTLNNDNELDEFDPLFIENLKKLFFRPDITPSIRLQFIIKFGERTFIAKLIVEWLKDPRNHRAFYERNWNPSSDEFFKDSSWVSIDRTTRPYLLLLTCLESSRLPLDNSLLHFFKYRPDNFDPYALDRQLDLWSLFPFAIAFETIYWLNEGHNKKIEVFTESMPATNLIGSTIPLELLKKLLQACKEEFPLKTPHVIPYIAVSIFEYRKEEVIKELLDELLPNIKTYITPISVESIFKAIDTPKKLEWVLEGVQKLPEEQRNAYLRAFSQGILINENPVSLELKRDVIVNAFQKKNLDLSMGAKIPIEQFMETFN